MSDAPKPPSAPEPTLRGELKTEYASVRRGFFEWLQLQPLGVRVLVVLAILAAGYAARSSRADRDAAQPPPPQPVSVIVEMRSPDGAPLVAGAPAEGRGAGPARRLLANAVKRRLAERLQRDGFALAGGDPTPLTRDQAAQAVDRLDDEVVLHGAVASGAVADGRVLDRLGAILDWLVANADKIERVLKWLMGLLMLL